MKYYLGEQLKKYFEENFITQSILANQIGISAQTLSNIITGRIKRPSNDTLIKISKEIKMKLGMDENGIYYSDDIPPPTNSDPLTPLEQECLTLFRQLHSGFQKQVIEIMKVMLKHVESF